jgi:hypothetical protein
MAKHQKSIKARIDEELAKLRQRPRETEADIKALSKSDWGAASKAALTLRDNDDYLKKAFEAADLDRHSTSLGRIGADSGEASVWVAQGGATAAVDD